MSANQPVVPARQWRPSETPYLFDTHFDLHDRNEVEDRSILRFVPAMRHILADLDAASGNRRTSGAGTATD